MRDREKALAALDDLVEELGLPVSLHAIMVGSIDLDEPFYPDYKLEVRPHTVDHEQMQKIIEVLERHDLELYWYSFNQQGHMRVVEPGEVSER